MPEAQRIKTKVCLVGEAAGQDERPSHLDRIDMWSYRCGELDRPLRVGQVERQDEAVLDPHRGPQEDDGEKGSFGRGIRRTL